MEKDFKILHHPKSRNDKIWKCMLVCPRIWLYNQIYFILGVFPFYDKFMTVVSGRIIKCVQYSRLNGRFRVLATLVGGQWLPVTLKRQCVILNASVNVRHTTWIFCNRLLHNYCNVKYVKTIGIRFSARHLRYIDFRCTHLSHENTQCM